jgi:hypothetical protein
MAVVVGRRSLPGDVSGSFAAMATAAVSCLFLPQAIATIAFPRFVADGSRALLLRATAAAFGVGAACGAVLGIRPDVVFLVLFGGGYRPDRLVLLVLCLHFVLLGCLAVLTQYAVARRIGGTVSVWLALGGAVASAWSFGDSPLAVAIALVVPTAAVTAAIAARTVSTRVAGASGVEVGPVPDRPDDTDPSGSLVSAARAAALLRRPPSLELSVVVPTFNGGPGLARFVAQLVGVLRATGWSVEVVVSIDGSTDGSDAALAALDPMVVVERDHVNLGKGAALRRGFAASRGEIVAFIDGDGDIDARVLVELVESLRSGSAWVAVASKNLPGARVSVSLARRIMSAGYRGLVHWVFDLTVTDTQCGCKAFRRRPLAEVLMHSHETGFAIDLELLTIGRRLGLVEVAERPVVMTRSMPGTVGSRTVLRMATDTWRIRGRLPPATRAPMQITAAAPIAMELSSPLGP